MKKKVFSGLVFTVILLLVTMTALADMPTIAPVATREQLAQMKEPIAATQSILDALWDFYVVNYSGASEQERLLYETLSEKVEIIYYADDWQTLKDDLEVCYKQTIEQRAPSWEAFQTILRKEYSGITQSSDGFAKREQIQLLMPDYLKACGFDIADMPNFSCYYMPYYEAYRITSFIRMGTDTRAMSIAFTPNMASGGHMHVDAYSLKNTSIAPTVQDKATAESIAKAFLNAYPHPFGTEAGEATYGETLSEISNEKVIKIVFFMGNFDGETLSLVATGDILNDKYAYFLIGLDSGKIYDYSPMASLYYLEDL